MAAAFGLAVPLLHGGRVLLWGHWPPLLELPVDIDAFVAGAFLLYGVVLVSRDARAGRPALAAGWGFSCGIIYRSFFEQLADSGRQAGHEMLVMVVKGALLAFAIAGLVGAIRPRSASDVARLPASQ
jgi:hypothetical protein